MSTRSAWLVPVLVVGLLLAWLLSPGGVAGRPTALAVVTLCATTAVGFAVRSFRLRRRPRDARLSLMGSGFFLALALDGVPVLVAGLGESAGTGIDVVRLGLIIALLALVPRELWSQPVGSGRRSRAEVSPRAGKIVRRDLPTR